MGEVRKPHQGLFIEFHAVQFNKNGFVVPVVVLVDTTAPIGFISILLIDLGIRGLRPS